MNMKKFITLINNIETFISGVLLCSIVGLLFIQVVARYGVGKSISWAEELSRFGLLGLVYISAAIGAQKGTHIRISAHLKLLPPKLRLCVNILADLIWVAFNIIVIVESIKLIDSMNRRPLISGALMWNMQYIFALIPVGFGFQTIRVLQRWVLIATGRIKPSKEAETAS